MPIFNLPGLSDHSNVHEKISSLGFGWRSILTSVLGIAVLMSGFFWLGYWTSELNIEVRGGSLFVAPSPRRLPGLGNAPRDNPATNKTEKVHPRHEVELDDEKSWVNL